MFKTHIRNILLILVLVGCVFINAIPNGFIGDDEVKLVNNTFYRNAKNVKLLFSPDYIARSNSGYIGQQVHADSGEVSYRPVVSLTYFLDYKFWKMDSRGYHFVNVIIHLASVILIYLIVLCLFQRTDIGVIASLVFGFIPIHADPVCTISYRPDLLATLFLLGSFYCYLHRENSTRSRYWIAGTYLGYFLSLFSKEAGIVFPGIIFLYDWIVQKKGFITSIKRIFTTHFPVVLITAFYLFIYIKIFPNQTVTSGQWHGPTLATHVATIFKIFFHYFWSTLNPFSVKTLPPFYVPSYEFTLIDILGVLFLIGLIGILMIEYWKKERALFFSLMWFCMFFIPVSEIIPKPTPMAYRYAYLPSVGICILLAYALSLIRAKLKYIVVVLYLLIMGYCTVNLNSQWKDPYTMAKAMVKSFPEDSRAQMYIAIEEFKLGKINLARQSIQKSLDLGIDDPRANHLMALLSPDKLTTKHYLLKNKERFPDYQPSQEVLKEIGE